MYSIRLHCVLLIDSIIAMQYMYVGEQSSSGPGYLTAVCGKEIPASWILQLVLYLTVHSYIHTYNPNRTSILLDLHSLKYTYIHT